MEIEYEKKKNQELMDEIYKLSLKHTALKNQMIALLDEYDKLASELSDIEETNIKIIEILKTRV